MKKVIDDVNSLDDAYQWPFSYWRRLSQPSVERAAARMDSLSICTAFSGVCAPSTALFLLMVVYKQFIMPGGAPFTTAGPGSGIPSLSYVAGIEWNKECRDELQCLLHPPSTLFGNIMDFASESLKGSYNDMMAAKSLTFEKIRHAVFSPGAVVRQAYCVRSRTVKVHAWAWLSIGGHPCTDYSSQGSLKKEDGITAIYFLVWAALQLLILPHVIVSENVANYPERVLRSVFEQFYDISSTVLKNTTFGNALSRTRRFTVMTLRTRVSLSRPLSMISDTFKRRICAHTLEDYLVASHDELNSELQWASSREGSGAFNSCGPSPTVSADPSDLMVFESCLASYEKKHLSSFRELASRAASPGSVFALSQNPEQRPQQSRNGILQCIFAEVHLLWHEQRRRWYTVRELLAAMGFPVYQDLQRIYLPAMSSVALAATPLCSFNSNRRAAGFKGRKRTAMSHQCGNSMAVSSIGAVIMWILAYTVENSEKEDTPRPKPLLDQLVVSQIMTPTRSSSSLTSSSMLSLSRQPTSSQSQFDDDNENSQFSQVSQRSFASVVSPPLK